MIVQLPEISPTDSHLLTNKGQQVNQQLLADNRHAVSFRKLFFTIPKCVSGQEAELSDSPITVLPLTRKATNVSKDLTESIIQSSFCLSYPGTHWLVSGLFTLSLCGS